MYNALPWQHLYLLLLLYVLNKNIDKATGNHFNKRGHSISDMRITILEKIYNTDPNYRKEREKMWIQKFNTKYKGMNKNCLLACSKKWKISPIFLKLLGIGEIFHFFHLLTAIIFLNCDIMNIFVVFKECKYAYLDSLLMMIN